MTNTQLNGRPVSCWKQENGTYHMAVSDGEGSGGVIVMSQFEVICALGGKSDGPDLSITCKAPNNNHLGEAA